MSDVQDQSQPATPRLPRIRWWRRILLPSLLAIAIGAVLIPIDWPVRDAIRSADLGGDLKRAFETIGEFGSLGVMIVVALAILLLDRERFRRVLDWGLAAILAGVLIRFLKVLTGRHRPDAGLESVWIGPLGKFDFLGDGTLHRPIEFWHQGVYENLSMPSGHTMQATIAACFLAHMYPPLRWLVWPLVAITALTRVYVGAHWASDTVVAAGLGIALGHLVINRYWGVRLLDWIWVRVVDRGALPAFPESLRIDCESKWWGAYSDASSSR